MNRVKRTSRLYAGHRNTMDEMRRRRKIRRAAARMDGIYAGTRVLLEGKTVRELKELCKEKGVTGYSKLKKDELTQRLLEKMVMDADAA